MDIGIMLVLDQWFIDVDAADNPILVGQAGGEPHRSAPIINFGPGGSLVFTNDGNVYALTTPDMSNGRKHPFALAPEAEQRHQARADAALERIRNDDLPQKQELEAAPVLTFWSVQEDRTGRYLAGIVHDHPRLEDGHRMTSSALLWISENRTPARTLSRWYRLR